MHWPHIWTLLVDLVVAVYANVADPGSWARPFEQPPPPPPPPPPSFQSAHLEQHLILLLCLDLTQSGIATVPG